MRVLRGEHGIRIRVYHENLGCDVYVIIVPKRDGVHVPLGWIEGEQIEEAPVIWQLDRKGDRIGYYHRVAYKILKPMPPPGESFILDCTHEAGMWDYEQRAWQCFDCLTFRLDSTQDEVIREQDERFEYRVSRTFAPTEQTDVSTPTQRKFWAERQLRLET